MATEVKVWNLERAKGDPSNRWEPVTPNDDADIGMPSAIYVGTGGDVVAIPANGTEPRTFKNVPSGTILPIVPQRVMAATTAADILALF